MFAVTIDLDAYDNLPPRQLKAMLRALRFADEDGVVHASLTMLAMPGLSRSTVHRELGDLTGHGHVARRQRPEGGFLWRIGRRFRCRAGKGLYPIQPPGGRPGSWDDADHVHLAEPADEKGLTTIKTLGGSPDCTSLNAGIPAFKPSAAADSHAVAGIPATDGTPVPADETPVPQRGTTDSRAPARLELSSGSKEPSERELSLSQDEIPGGWEAAAAAERGLAGLGPVNLQREWRALLAHVEGARITIWRWRGWALKARCERNPSDDARDLTTGIPVVSAASKTGIPVLPGDERQQRQARDWVHRGFWLRDGSWGPAPDQPGCELPPDLVAWCLRERQARAA